MLFQTAPVQPGLTYAQLMFQRLSRRKLSRQLQKPILCLHLVAMKFNQLHLRYAAQP